MSAAIDLITKFILATIELRPLAAAIARIKHVAPRKSALPVLEYVLLRVVGHQFTMIVTDLNVTAKVTLPAGDTSNGELLVPMSALASIVRPSRGKGIVTLSNNRLTVGGANFTLPTFDPTSYPGLPEMPPAVEAIVPRTTLARMVRTVAYAMSTDETRPHLAGALLERIDGELRLVATDGHRLATASTPNAGLNFKCIVHRRGIEELARMVAVSGGPISIHRTNNHVWFVSGDDFVSSKLVDATFPSWQQVVPSDRSGSITTRRLELLTALTAVVQRGTTGVKIRTDVASDAVELSADDGEGASAQAFVGAEVLGNVPRAFGINAQYLRELVEALGDDAMVTLAVEGELDPVKVVGETECVHVVMPMRC